ncbi:hypothetical protein, partial [Lentimonas sp. CC11]|uniref:hypothetical protein n=1 Tax=Lentimonas sp. CC11 TaxID=2676096 RepID=UPI0013534AE6
MICNSSRFNLKVAFFGALSIFAIVSAHADRVARILYYGAPKSAPKTSFVYTAQGEDYSRRDPQEVVLERHNFSKSFDLADGAVRLGFLPQRLPKRAVFPDAAPSLSIPASWSKVLILVFEDPNNPIMPIRVQAIDASDTVFGPGELLFINYSEASIFGMVGDKKLILKPQTTVLLSEPAKEKGSYRVKLDSVKDTIETRQWLLRQSWRHEPEVRRVVFVFP